MDPLELALNRQHDIYFQEGRAKIWKTPDPIVPQSDGTYRKDKAVSVDFSGFCLKTGLSLNLEAKYCGLTKKTHQPTNQSSFKLSMLQSKQLEILTIAAKTPAMCAIFVRRHLDAIRTEDYLIAPLWIVSTQTLSNRSTAYRTKISRLQWPGKRPKFNTIPWENIQEWKIPQGRTWLDAFCVGTSLFWDDYKRIGWKALKPQ